MKHVSCAQNAENAISLQVATMSTSAFHQTHSFVAGCCTRLVWTTSPPSAPMETMVRHASLRMLPDSGMSTQGRLAFVTPFRNSSTTECQQIATLHLSPHSASLPTGARSPKQTPLTDIWQLSHATDSTSTPNHHFSGCMALMQSHQASYHLQATSSTRPTGCCGPWQAFHLHISFA